MKKDVVILLHRFPCFIKILIIAKIRQFFHGTEEEKREKKKRKKRKKKRKEEKKEEEKIGRKTRKGDNEAYYSYQK